MNGNVASMFLGVAAILFFCAWRRTRNRIYLIVGVCAYGAVFFTGSKTGIILALILPAVGAAVRFTADRSGKAALGALLLVGGPILTALLAVFGDTLSGFSAAVAGRRTRRGQSVSGPSLRTFSSQTLYSAWGTVAGLLQPEANSGPPPPPHNLLIAAWADAGILAMALTTGGLYCRHPPFRLAWTAWPRVCHSRMRTRGMALDLHSWHGRQHNNFRRFALPDTQRIIGGLCDSGQRRWGRSRSPPNFAHRIGRGC